MSNDFYMVEGDLIGWLEFRIHVIDNGIEDAVVYCDDGIVIKLNRYAVPIDAAWPRYEDRVSNLTSILLSKQIGKRKKERETK